MASNDPSAQTPPSPAAFVVDGKEYTEADLQEAIRGGLRQADYTRKTQVVSERQRELDEREERLAALQEEMEERARQYGRTSRQPDEDEDDPWAQRFSRLESKVDTTLQALTERQKSEAAERAMQEQIAGINTALDALSIKPGFDRNEVLLTMKQYGMDRPDQVEAAYRIVAGPKIGQVIGERAAAARGASEPAVMGGTGFAMATPFSSPREAAPSVDYSQLSWEQVKEMALKDPDRPR